MEGDAKRGIESYTSTRWRVLSQLCMEYGVLFDRADVTTQPLRVTCGRSVRRLMEVIDFGAVTWDN
jgi:hypothetical protein